MTIKNKLIKFYDHFFVPIWVFNLFFNHFNPIINLMSKFILVHDVPTGNPVVINTDDIRLIDKSELYTGASAIHGYLGDVIPEPFIHVTETPEQIFEMLNK